VAASPINPSDLIFIKSKGERHIHEKIMPCTPGWEGSGIVIKNGGGIAGWSLNGKRVAFASNTKHHSGGWG